MTSLDLQTWLSLISTVAIMLALVIAGVQVREANRARRDQAAVALLQSAQGDTWTRAMNSLAQLLADASADQLDAAGSGRRPQFWTLASALRRSAIWSSRGWSRRRKWTT